MKLRLLDWLMCPGCGNPDLRLRAFHFDTQASPPEVLDGLLECAGCRSVYPVVGGIPRMLPDSYAKYRNYLCSQVKAVLPDPPQAAGKVAAFRDLHEATGEAFSFEWLRYQVTDEEENRWFFRRVLGCPPGELAGRLVLDAGCGMGRFLEVAAGCGAEVVGVDLSRSVERAWRETRHRSRVHLIQGNLMQPPLRPQCFDNIYSIGVLHHTPGTRQSFQSLCPLLRSAGRISIWVYRTFQPEIPVEKHKRAFAFLCQLASDGARLLTTRMPHRLLHYLCYGAVPLGWLKRKVYERPVTKYLFWPLLLLPISSHEKWQVRLCDTFDWLAPKFQWKHTTREVMNWFRAEGLSEVQAGEWPVSVTGIVPEVKEAGLEPCLTLAGEEYAS